MKFHCGSTPDDETNLFLKLQENRVKRLTKWHEWFAMQPVEVAPNDCRWLEVVMRRGIKGNIWAMKHNCFYPTIIEWEYKSMDRLQPEGVLA